MTQKFKILLIDDEKEYCEEVVKALGNLFDIDVCFDAKSPIQQLEKNKYDLVLLDLFLEKEDVPDGLELMVKLRKIWPSLPIIIITKYKRWRITYNALKEHSGDDYLIIKQEESFEQWAKKIEKVIKIFFRKRIFVSYSSKDKELVHLIIQKLEGFRIKFLTYEKENSVGENILTKMMSMIDRSDAILLMISKNSATENGYVDKELKYAKKRNKKIYPVMLEKMNKIEDFPGNWTFDHMLDEIDSVNIYEAQEMYDQVMKKEIDKLKNSIFKEK